MRITPLPVRTRLYHGETLDSYIQQQAARNFCMPSDVDRALRERGIVKSKNRRDPARVQAWLELAGTSAERFTAPEYVLDQEVTERVLCLRCTRGEPARGKLTGIGLVCIRHRRWLGSPQIDLHGYFPALAAERHFRRHLAARDVLHDSLPMLIGRECASPAIIGASEIDRRRIEFGIDAVDSLTYPEQVKIARLLCLPAFLCAATDPDTDSARRSSLVTRAVEDHPRSGRCRPVASDQPGVDGHHAPDRPPTRCPHLWSTDARHVLQHSAVYSGTAGRFRSVGLVP